jgi:hypothetical protein
MENTNMTMYEDVMAIEEGTETEAEMFESIQRMINAGNWSLQGSFGRTMMDAIKSGRCMLGKNRAMDAYRNIIPSRTDVKAGTFGSAKFTADRFGKAYAKRMAAL